jgi:hypothetical protein
MYKEGLLALKHMENDDFYNIKKNTEALNFFVCLAKDYKIESLKYFLPSLKRIHKRLFWIGIIRFLRIDLIKNKLN